MQMEPRELEHLWKVVCYLYDDESKDYDECGECNERREGHIFNSVLALEAFLKRHPEQYEGFVQRRNAEFEAYQMSLSLQ